MSGRDASPPPDGPVDDGSLADGSNDSDDAASDAKDAESFYCPAGEPYPGAMCFPDMLVCTYPDPGNPGRQRVCTCEPGGQVFEWQCSG